MRGDWAHRWTATETRAPRVGDRVAVRFDMVVALLVDDGIEPLPVEAGLTGVVVAVRPHGQGYQVDVASGSRVFYLGSTALDVLGPRP